MTKSSRFFTVCFSFLLGFLLVQCRASESKSSNAKQDRMKSDKPIEVKDTKPKIDPLVEKLVVTARIQGAEDRLRALIKQGADVNAFNQDGINALMASLLVGRVGNAGFLKAQGASLTVKNHRGEDPVSYALFSAKNPSLEWVLSHGVKLSGLDRKALVRIACLGDEKTIKMGLIDTGQVNFRDSLQETALIHAARCNRLDNIKLLVKVGADLNLVNDRKRTALTVAVIFDHREVVRYLLSKKADTLRQDYQNRSALEYAKLLERKEIGQMIAKSTRIPGAGKKK